MKRVIRRRYGKVRSKDQGVPRACDCSVAVMVQTSNDPTMRGMQFFHCPYEISDGSCPSFEMVLDKDVVSEGCGTRPYSMSLKKSGKILSHCRSPWMRPMRRLQSWIIGSRRVRMMDHWSRL